MDLGNNVEIDEKHQIQAALNLASNGEETLFDVDAAIAQNDMACIYKMADRLALLDIGAYGQARVKILAHFKTGAQIKFLDSAVKESRIRLLTPQPNGVMPEEDAWQKKIMYNELGKMQLCAENLALFMEHHNEWRGVLGYNELTGSHYIRSPPPEPVTSKVGDELSDVFDTEALRWVERHGFVGVKVDILKRVIDAIANNHPYHPVREYLTGLPEWDRTPRLGSWLIDYCGVASSDSSPNLYAMTIGEKFLISAVARIMRPGCKADHVLILEGAQGIGKSTAVKILGGQWFTDQVEDFGSKDASMQIRGAWIIELPELAFLKRDEMEKVKSFISATEERFRPPYGRRVVTHQRQCVFIGTTNSESWLSDETGARRFWPVKCKAIDMNGLAHDRDQLWAEALLRYRQGVKWHLEDREQIAGALKEQDARYKDDVWQTAVEVLVEAAGGADCSVPEILQRLGIDKSHHDQVNSNRVGRCLKRAGLEKYRATKNGVREWRYRKPTLLPGQEEA